MKEQELINSLKGSTTLGIRCKCCSEVAPMSEFVFFAINDKNPDLTAIKENMNKELEILKEKYKKTSQTEDKRRDGTYSSVLGQTLEEFVPILHGFNFNFNECRFLADPVDYIVFEGISQKNKDIEHITFLEIKTGKGTLNENQKSIKKGIENNRVKFDLI